MKERVKDYPTYFDLSAVIKEGFGIPEKVILFTEKRIPLALAVAKSLRVY